MSLNIFQSLGHKIPISHTEFKQILQIVFMPSNIKKKKSPFYTKAGYRLFILAKPHQVICDGASDLLDCHPEKGSYGLTPTLWDSNGLSTH